MAESHDSITSTRSRDVRLDALRGLAIVLVVVGHALGAAYPDTYLTHPAQIILYSFHLPLFAAVAGYVTRHREGTAAEFIAKRLRTLMIPYVSWYLIWSFVSAVRDRDFTGYLAQLVMALVSPRADNALWFLYALFLASVLFRMVWRAGRSDAATGASLIAAIILFASGVTRDWWLLDADRVLWLYIFFAAGHLSALPQGVRAWPRGLALCAAIAAYIPAMALTWGVDGSGRTVMDVLTGESTVGLMAERVALVVAGAAAVLLLRALFDYCPERMLRPLAFFGTRSVGIYAIHKRVIFLTLETLAGGFWLPFGVALLTSTALTLLLERIPIASNVLLGRPAISRR